MITFSDLHLTKFLWQALEDLGLQYPTTIQHKTFSPIMSGKDIVGIAQTGTGKTYAYLLPTLRMWKFTKSPHAQILVIVPTRELVAQVVEEVEKLTKYMNVSTAGVYGGTNIKMQKAELSLGVDVIVGTPGRLVDLMLDGVLKAKHIKKLIIDEVDEMLHLGFRTQLRTILDFLPERRQTLMFSATMPEEVEAIVNLFTDYYTKIEAAPSGTPLESIDQYLFRAPNFNTKANLLEHLLDTDTSMSKVLVFVSIKKMADALYERLFLKMEERVGVIHSSKSQNTRFNTVNRFQEGEMQVVIATDIIARGLDISEVTHVVNFDLPDVAEQYIHRIGRTGRAEKKGIAISFVTESNDAQREAIEALMDMTIPESFIPEGVQISEELIDLEKPVEFVPFNNHKMRQHKPTGDAFHEKKDKNKKTNVRFNYEDEMKKKYKKQYRKNRK